MDIYSSYEVQIEGIPNITVRIADSNLLLESFFDELKRLISDHNARNKSEKTKKPAVVGFHLEWDYKTSPVLLQLCFGTHCVIIQLLHTEFNKMCYYLNGISADLGTVFVGVGIKNKLGIFGYSYPLTFSKKVIELGSLADRVHRTCKFFGSKLEELAREIVGIEIKKPNQFLHLADWAAGDLTTQQIEYATINAYASYSLGYKLLAGNGTDGNS